MPPLSQQQRQAIEAAWGRGVRDKASLFAAAGIGIPGTPTAVVPAAVPPPMPGQLPPPGEGFIEQGGLLGLAARAPGTKQILQGLGWLGENILSPTSTAMVVGAQRIIPGQQMREKAFDVGAAEAEARGEGIFGQLGAAFTAGAHEAFDTPVTTGLGIDLPGGGIPMPDWLAGPGKRLDVIDVGQLAAELPAEILGLKGAGFATRPARVAAAAKVPERYRPLLLGRQKKKPREELEVEPEPELPSTAAAREEPDFTDDWDFMGGLSGANFRAAREAELSGRDRAITKAQRDAAQDPSAQKQLDTDLGSYKTESGRGPKKRTLTHVLNPIALKAALTQHKRLVTQEKNQRAHLAEVRAPFEARMKIVDDALPKANEKIDDILSSDAASIIDPVTGERVLRINYNPKWITEGPGGTPVPKEIVPSRTIPFGGYDMEVAKVIEDLREAAAEVVRLTEEQKFVTAKLYTLGGSKGAEYWIVGKNRGKLPDSKAAPEVRNIRKTRALREKKDISTLTPMIDAVRKALTAQYSSVAGGVFGLDVLKLSHRTPANKAIFEDALSTLDEARKVGERARSDYRLRDEAAARAGTEFPRRELTAEEVAAQAQADWRSKTQTAIDQAETKQALDTGFREARERSAQGSSAPGRTWLEPLGAADDFVDEAIPDVGDGGIGNRTSIPDGTAGPGPGKNKFRTKATNLIRDTAEAKISYGLLARIARWRERSMIGSEPGFFHEFSSAALKRTVNRTAARILENTLGAVDPVAIMQMKVFRWTSAYTARLQSRRHQAKIDVTQFFQVSLGLTPADAMKAGNIEAALQKRLPIDAESGMWGASKLAGFDVVEAYWAFLDGIRPTASSTDFIKNYKNIYNKFFKASSADADILRKFDAFFNETTEAGAAGTKQFLADLKVYYKELDDALLDSLTDVEKIRLPNFMNGKDLTLLTYLGRSVKEFAEGGTPTYTGFSVPQRFARIHPEMLAGLEAGVKYDYNIRQQLIEMDTVIRKFEADKEMRDLFLDPDEGIAIALGGLAHKIVSFADSEAGKELTDPALLTFIGDLRQKLKKVQDDYDKVMNPIQEATKAGRALTPAQIDAKRKAILDRDTGIREQGQRVIQSMDGHTKGVPPLTWPSNIFWANQLEKPMTVDALRGLMGLTTGNVSVSDLNQKVLGKIGLKDVVLFQALEMKEITKAWKMIDHLVYSDAMPVPIAQKLGRPGFTTELVSGAANWWRFTSTGFDFAFQFTIGLPLLFIDPVGWTKTTTTSLRAFFDEDVFARMVDRDPDLFNTLHEMIMDGIPPGDVEIYKALEPRLVRATGMGTEPSGAAQSVSAVDEAALKATLAAGKSPLTRGGAFAKWGSKKFQRSYNTGAMMARIYWYRALKDQYTTIATDGTRIVDNIGLRSAVANVTASLNISELGRSVSAKQIENLVVGLSPRLTRSVAAMFLSANRGAMKIAASRDRNLLQFALTQGKSGKSPLQVARELAEREGRELTPQALKDARELTKQAIALGNLSTALMASIATFYMLNLAHAKATGLSDDQAQQRALSSIDPRQGKKFLSMNVAGEWLGIGGFWRSLAKAEWELIYGTAEAINGNYEPIARFQTMGRYDNPLIQLYMNRGAPMIEFGGKLIEGVSGALGEVPIDAAPYDIVDNLWQLPLSAVESYMPFAIQGALDGEGKESFFFGLAGGRTGQMTPSDALVYLARKTFTKHVDSSRDLSESWLKRDLLYPMVEDQYSLSARTSNSPFGLFTVRRETLEKDFLADIMREYAAGNTNYELISLYYDRRQVMHERLDEYEKAVGVGDFDVNPKDPIAVALRAWRDIYEKPEVTQALKDDRWDIIDAFQAKELEGFTQEQKEAVMRSGSGMHREILALLKPESQLRYFERYNLRKKWILENVRDPEQGKAIAKRLLHTMFPSLNVQRGVTQESLGKPMSISPSRTPWRPL